MNLFQLLESDTKLWLSLNEKNIVRYEKWNENQYQTIGINANNNICFDNIFEHMKNSDYFQRICYANEKDDILIVSIKNETTIMIYFSGIPYCYSQEFNPSVSLAQGIVNFYYQNSKGTVRCKPMISLYSVKELFSIITVLSLSVAHGKYIDNITTYYDSLPLLDIFSYVLGIPCDTTDKEIVIEI